jgi:hypothetical protein
VAEYIAEMASMPEFELAPMTPESKAALARALLRGTARIPWLV